MNPRHHDRITVEKDGERIDVFNWVNVTQRYVIRPNQSERFTLKIGAGDSSVEPDYITEWLAGMIWSETSVDVEGEEYDIEVIDIESEEVTVI